MASVQLSQVSKSFGKQTILSALDLRIEEREFMVLVGPSGCGKSTILRLVAGLEAPTSGEIMIGGKAVTRLDPKARGVAMVFQSYALYPHMSVRGNLAFALELVKTPKVEIQKRVDEAAETLGITSLLDKKPATLSGGQKQRVAIGRALVRRPKVFLFDEPLSNLDAQLRVKMRSELAELHRRLGATIIYVTHDQVEAMTLATRVAVLNGGNLEQVGPPLAVYARPATKFVAAFLGSPPMNILSIQALGSAALSEIRPPATAESFGFRPEDVSFSPVGGSISLGMARVRLVEPLGAQAHVHLQLQESYAAVADMRVQAAPELNAQLTAYTPKAKLTFFAANGRQVQ